MRAGLALGAVLLVVAGCTEVLAPGVQVPADVCARPFVLVADERVREATAEGARLEFLLRNDSAERPLGDVAFTVRWGRDSGDAREARGTLADVRSPWGLLDRAPAGRLGADDRLILEVAGAKASDLWAAIDLGDARGTFLGGTARCM